MGLSRARKSIATGMRVLVEPSQHHRAAQTKVTLAALQRWG